MPELVGFSHIDLTVTDCERSAAWWQEVLGFRLLTRTEEATFTAYALIHPSGLVVDVLTHRDTRRDRFDERRVGLDHFSMRVADRDALTRWADHLDRRGVAHSGIVEGAWGPTLVFRDPDNIQLELFVHPTPEDVAERLAGA